MRRRPVRRRASVFFAAATHAAEALPGGDASPAGGVPSRVPRVTLARIVPEAQEVGVPVVVSLRTTDPSSQLGVPEIRAVVPPCRKRLTGSEPSGALVHFPTTAGTRLALGQCQRGWLGHWGPIADVEFDRLYRIRGAWSPSPTCTVPSLRAPAAGGQIDGCGLRSHGCRDPQVKGRLAWPKRLPDQDNDDPAEGFCGQSVRSAAARSSPEGAARLRRGGDWQNGPARVHGVLATRREPRADRAAASSRCGGGGGDCIRTATRELSGKDAQTGRRLGTAPRCPTPPTPFAGRRHLRQPAIEGSGARVALRHQRQRAVGRALGAGLAETAPSRRKQIRFPFAYSK
jgi:hypothetical protein